MNRYYTAIALPILWSSSAMAGIIRVPQDQPGIQQGINEAVNGDTVLVSDSTYFENIDFKGKAIMVASYMLIDSDTTHRNNTVINGSQPVDLSKGAVVSFVSGEDTNSIIYGFTITGGTGTIYGRNDRVGGGIYCMNSGARIVSNLIINNSVNYNQISWGGGIGVFPFQNLKHVVLEENVIESNSIHGNNGALGGGIHIIKGRIINNRINFNICSAASNIARGGGIHAHCDTSFQRTLVVISGNTIANNLVTCSEAAAGGGGFDTFGNYVQLESNIISYNNVSAGYCYAPGVNIEFSKENSKIKNNIISFNSPLSGECDAGGLGMYGTIGLTIEGNHIESNSAHRGAGYGEWYTSGSVISENTFINNRASYFGGGLYVNTSESKIFRNKISGNRAATYNGGGIFITNCSPHVANNIITGNKSVLNGGGIYVFSNSQAQIINNTIVADTAGIYGGGICTNNALAVVINTILWDNVAPNGSQIYVIGGDSQVHYCDIQGTTWSGIGNIDANPLFNYPDLTLGQSSPCMDSGNPDPLYNDPNGSRNDMGAYGGSDPITSLINERSEVRRQPNTFVLFQNYPNPFNPITSIEFYITGSEWIDLKIYNLLGQEVTALVNNQRLAPGIHKYEWDAQGFAGGVYFYKLRTGDHFITRKMILIR